MQDKFEFLLINLCSDHQMIFLDCGIRGGDSTPFYFHLVCLDSLGLVERYLIFPLTIGNLKNLGFLKESLLGRVLNRIEMCRIDRFLAMSNFIDHMWDEIESTLRNFCYDNQMILLDGDIKYGESTPFHYHLLWLDSLGLV